MAMIDGECNDSNDSILEESKTISTVFLSVIVNLLHGFTACISLILIQLNPASAPIEFRIYVIYVMIVI